MAQALKLKKNEGKVIYIPPELLWDYKEPPDDILWRLQRIADFFPAYGTERETVELLFEYRDKLKLEEGKYKLIALYKEVWDEKAAKGHTK
ncbi:MAG: hypothetical protein ACOYU2_05905 [Nitrospirota bacterium]|jgi:hypothetical protein